MWYRSYSSGYYNSSYHSKQMLLTNHGATSACPIQDTSQCIIMMDEVLQQLQSTYVGSGIIKQSNSLWMAPAIFVQKNLVKLGCVDYRALN